MHYNDFIRIVLIHEICEEHAHQCETITVSSLLAEKRDLRATQRQDIGIMSLPGANAVIRLRTQRGYLLFVREQRGKQIWFDVKRDQTLICC